MLSSGIHAPAPAHSPQIPSHDHPPSSVYSSTRVSARALSKELANLRISYDALKRTSVMKQQELQLQNDALRRQIDTLRALVAAVENERDQLRDLHQYFIDLSGSDVDHSDNASDDKSENEQPAVLNPVYNPKNSLHNITNVEIRGRMPTRNTMAPPAVPSIKKSEQTTVPVSDLKRHPSVTVIEPEAKRVQSKKFDGNHHPTQNFSEDVQTFSPTSARDQNVHQSRPVYVQSQIAAPKAVKSSESQHPKPSAEEYSPRAYGPFPDNTGIYPAPAGATGKLDVLRAGPNPSRNSTAEIVSPVPVSPAKGARILSDESERSPVSPSDEVDINTSDEDSINNDDCLRLQRKREFAEKMEEQRIREAYPSLAPSITRIPVGSLLDDDLVFESPTVSTHLQAPLQPIPQTVTPILKKSNMDGATSEEETLLSFNDHEGLSPITAASAASVKNIPVPKNFIKSDSPPREHRVTQASGVEATKRIIAAGIIQAKLSTSQQNSVLRAVVESRILKQRQVQRKIDENYDLIREVSIRRLSPDMEISSILDQMKFGQIERVEMIRHDKEIRIFFVEPVAARTCHETLQVTGVWKEDHTIAKLNSFLWNSDSKLDPELKDAIYKKRATRVLWLANLPRGCKAEKLARDCIDPENATDIIDIIDNVKIASGCGEIKFTSVSYCLRARQRLKRLFEYKDTDSMFGPDPCGEVNGRPPRKVPRPFKRFVPEGYAGKIVEDSDSEDDQPESTSDHRKSEEVDNNEDGSEDPEAKPPKPPTTNWQINFTKVTAPQGSIFTKSKMPEKPRGPPGPPPHEKGRASKNSTPTPPKAGTLSPVGVSQTDMRASPPLSGSRPAMPPVALQRSFTSQGFQASHAVQNAWAQISSQAQMARPASRSPVKDGRPLSPFVFTGMPSGSRTPSNTTRSLQSQYPANCPLVGMSSDVRFSSTVPSRPFIPAPTSSLAPKTSREEFSPEEEMYYARTVRIKDLHPDTTMRELMSIISGGQIDAVSIRQTNEGNKYAIVVFLNSASAKRLRHKIESGSIFLHGNKIGVESMPGALTGLRLYSPRRVEKDRLSRCLILHDIPSGLLTEDLEESIIKAMRVTKEKLAMEKLEVVGSKGYAFFASIADAVACRPELERTWDSCTVEYAEDPCDQRY